MNTWTPIRYREFWDIPRIFLVPHRGQEILFDCAFDEATEDFPEHYRVYLLPALQEDELAGSWDKLNLKAIRYLGEVPIQAIRFDPSKRREVDTGILEELTARTGLE